MGDATVSDEELKEVLEKTDFTIAMLRNYDAGKNKAKSFGLNMRHQNKMPKEWRRR